MAEPSTYNVLLVRADGVDGGRERALSLLAEHFRLSASEAGRIVDSVPVVVRKRADDAESSRLVARLREMGFEARRIAAGSTGGVRAESVTGILKPLRRKTGDHDAVESERRRRRTTGSQAVADGTGERRARTTGDHVTVRASREWLRRLSGQFATVSTDKHAVVPPATPDVAPVDGDEVGPDAATLEAIVDAGATAEPASPAVPLTPVEPPAPVDSVPDALALEEIGQAPGAASGDGIDGSDAGHRSVGAEPSLSDGLALEPYGASLTDDAGAATSFADDAGDRAARTSLTGGSLDVDVDARTLAPPSALDAFTSDAPSADGVVPDDSPADSATGAAADGGFELTGNSLEVMATPMNDTAGIRSPDDDGVDPELTRALDEIAADLPQDEPWPDVTGLSEIPVQTPRGRPAGDAPPPPVAPGGSADAGASDVASLTDVARRSTVLDEMMSIDDEADYSDSPSIDDVIAGNAPIPSTSRDDVRAPDSTPGVPSDAPLELTHSSLEDSLNDISGAQDHGSTGPAPAVGAGRPTSPHARVPDRRGGGGVIRWLVAVLIVGAVVGIGVGTWWTLQKRSSLDWQFDRAPRHYEMVEMLDGVEARSACGIVAPGRELCRFSAEHVAAWFPDLEAVVIRSAADSCFVSVDTTSTDRRQVFTCTVRSGEGPDRHVWSLVARESRECSSPPGSLQAGDVAECTTRIERTVSRDGEAAVAPYTNTAVTAWSFDRLRESFSTNVGYFRVAELRVRPADATSGLPVLVAWALDIDRVVERYRPDGTMLEEIVYISEPTRRVGTPSLAPAPPVSGD